MSILSDRSNRPPASTINPYPRNFSRSSLPAGLAHSICGVSVGGGVSECLQEDGREWAAGLAIHGDGLGERLLLDREVGVHIYVA